MIGIRCKFRSAQRSKPPFVCANAYCEYRQKDCATLPRSGYAGSICGCARFEFRFRKTSRACQRMDCARGARLLPRSGCTLTIRCTRKRSRSYRSIFVCAKESPTCFPPGKRNRGPRITPEKSATSNQAEGGESFALCQNEKPSSEQEKMNAKASRLQPRRANLSARKWNTFAKENTGRDPPNRRSPSAYPKRAVPA